MSIKYVFAFNNKLPWKHEVASMVLDLAKGGAPSGNRETEVRKKGMYVITISLIELWKTAFFGDDNLFLQYSTVRKGIVEILKDYQNSVALPSLSHDEKRKSMLSGKNTKATYERLESQKL